MANIRFTTNGSYDAANAHDFTSDNNYGLAGGLTIVPDGNLFRYSTTGIQSDYFFLILPASGYISATEQDTSSDADQTVTIDAHWATDGLYVNATGFDFANLTGGDVGDYFIGSANADILNGAGGKDTLIGGAGNDILIGGAGADALDGGDGFDIASYATATSWVAVQLDNVHSGYGDGYGDVFTNIEGIIGSSYNDVLYGDSKDNVIDGGAGGVDYIDGGAGDDVVIFSSVYDSSASDFIKGGDGYDIAQLSFAGDARLLPDGTNFSLRTLTYASLADVQAFERVEVALGSQTLYIGAIVPTIAITGDAGNSIVLDQGMNTSTNVTFDGGAGNDFYQAGAGYDTIVFTGTGGVVANFSDSTVTIGGNDYDSGAALDGYDGHDIYLNVENIDKVVGSDNDDTIVLGSTTLIVLTGDGNDLIYSTANYNTINGGAGIDTVSYAYADHGVNALLGKPSGSVRINQGPNPAISGPASPPPNDALYNVENLAGSRYDDNLLGDRGDNILTGNGGNDSFYFSGGNDTFIGDGTGDIVWLAGLNSGNGTGPNDYNLGATVSLAETAAQNLGPRNGSVTLSGITGLTGSYLDDTLIGNANANTLAGADGNDVLMGGAGGDVLDGGNGIDTASYASAATGVTVNFLNVATNTGDAAGDSYVSIEKIVGSSKADSLRGNTGVTRVDGGGGNDVITISTNPYEIEGGAGTDQLIIAPRASVSLSDDSVSGIEQFLVRDGASVDFSDYGDNLASVRSTSSAASAATIIGGSGADKITQGAGADHLSGGEGNDTIFIANDRGVFDGGDGTGTGDLATIAVSKTAFHFSDDNFTGFERASIGSGDVVDFSGVTAPLTITATGTKGVTVTGTAGDDRITGNSGADTITGGAGADILFGRDGDDTFVFHSLAEMSNAKGTIDRILDFTAHDLSGHGDTIDLSAIDANPLTGEIDHFRFIGSAAFTGKTGLDAEVRVSQAPSGDGNYYLQFDVNHDGKIDAQMLIHSTNGISGSDLILGTEQILIP